MLKASKEKYLIFYIEIITYFAYRTQVFEMICIDLHDLQFQLSTLLPILKAGRIGCTWEPRLVCA